MGFKVTLITVGKFKKGDVAQELYETYAPRLKTPPTLIELTPKKTYPKSTDQKAHEGQLIMAAIPKGSFVIALDERGKNLSSLCFSKELEKLSDRGCVDLTFLIGGADGLDPILVERADWTLSLGAMTWPHLLVRGLVMEQLYRAQQTLAGHPYHRE